MSIINQANIKLEPVHVYYGSRQVDSVTAIADVGGALDGKYFLLKSGQNETTYYVWMDVDAGGNDPLVAGAVAIPVSIATGDAATVVGAAITAAVDANADFNASAGATADISVIERGLVGATDAAADGDSGFSFAEDTAAVGGDLGATEGVTFDLEFEDVEVMADQTGGQVLDLISSAAAVSVVGSFKELTKDFWTNVLGNNRGSVEGVGDARVIGIGDSKRFQNQSQYAKELVLKPIAESTHNRNYHFWLSVANPAGPNLDGSDLSVAEVTFTPLRDGTREDNKNLVIFGDGRPGYKK